MAQLNGANGEYTGLDDMSSHGGGRNHPPRHNGKQNAQSNNHNNKPRYSKQSDGKKNNAQLIETVKRLSAQLAAVNDVKNEKADEEAVRRAEEREEERERIAQTLRQMDSLARMEALFDNRFEEDYLEQLPQYLDQLYLLSTVKRKLLWNVAASAGLISCCGAKNCQMECSIGLRASTDDPVMITLALPISSLSNFVSTHDREKFVQLFFASVAACRRGENHWDIVNKLKLVLGLNCCASECPSRCVAEHQCAQEAYIDSACRMEASQAVLHIFNNLSFFKKYDCSSQSRARVGEILANQVRYLTNNSHIMSEPVFNQQLAANKMISGLFFPPHCCSLFCVGGCKLLEHFKPPNSVIRLESNLITKRLNIAVRMIRYSPFFLYLILLKIFVLYAWFIGEDNFEVFMVCFSIFLGAQSYITNWTSVKDIGELEAEHREELQRLQEDDKIATSNALSMRKEKEIFQLPVLRYVKIVQHSILTWWCRPFDHTYGRKITMIHRLCFPPLNLMEKHPLIFPLIIVWMSSWDWFSNFGHNFLFHSSFFILIFWACFVRMRTKSIKLIDLEVFASFTSAACNFQGSSLENFDVACRTQKHTMDNISLPSTLVMICRGADNVISMTKDVAYFAFVHRKQEEMQLTYLNYLAPRQVNDFWGVLAMGIDFSQISLLNLVRTLEFLTLVALPLTAVHVLILITGMPYLIVCSLLLPVLISMGLLIRTQIHHLVTTPYWGLCTDFVAEYLTPTWLVCVNFVDSHKDSVAEILGVLTARLWNFMTGCCRRTIPSVNEQYSLISTYDAPLESSGGNLTGWEYEPEEAIRPPENSNKKQTHRLNPSTRGPPDSEEDEEENPLAFGTNPFAREVIDSVPM